MIFALIETYLYSQCDTENQAREILTTNILFHTSLDHNNSLLWSTRYYAPTFCTAAFLASTWEWVKSWYMEMWMLIVVKICSISMRILISCTIFRWLCNASNFWAWHPTSTMYLLGRISISIFRLQNFRTWRTPSLGSMSFWCLSIIHICFRVL